jgi:hypothetical protein
MKKLYLTTGDFALVDKADHEYLSQFRWGLMRIPKGGDKVLRYAVRTINKNATTEMVLMHREILGVSGGQIVDHIDGDGLNNFRANLRLATVAQNQMNKAPIGASAYMGVSFDKSRERWRAQIKIGGKAVNLGRYATELEAARAYDVAAYSDLPNLAFRRLNRV